MQSTTARFHYRDENTGTEFVWHGGAYINIGHTQDQGVAGIHGDDFHAHDCINVWDYATDEPTIARTLDAFEQRCREWLTEQSEPEDLSDSRYH